MMVDKRGTVCVLMVCFVSMTTAQFETLEACLTRDFFNQYTGCIVEAVLNGIGLPRDLDDDEIGNTPIRAANRRLQSVTRDFANSRHLQQYYIEMRMEEAGIKENKLFEELKRAAKLWSITRSDESLSDKIRRLDVRQMFGDWFLSMLMKHLADIVPTVVELRNGKASDNPWINDDMALLGAEERSKLDDIRTCLSSFPDTAFEDGLDWLQCLISCDDLGPLWICTTEMMKVHSEPCSKVVWFADTLVSITASFLNKTHCHFVLDDPVNGTISLAEGGPEEYISFHSYLPPSVLCLGDPQTDIIPLGTAFVGHVFGFNVTCDVEMQLTTSNWIDDLVGKPRCRVDGRALRQVAIGYHDAAVNNSGVFKITDANWNATFTIPLLPVVDHRPDGATNNTLTIKMYVQGQLRGSAAKIPITVNDTDSGDIVECYSVNDPHIMTFDGHYYNNFYHGAFYLYKHDEYPYEIQAIFQPCEPNNQNGTCNCAVAVRSGDDVFVMDRCRRASGSGDVSQLTALYTNGPLTSGTRVFRMNGGLRHDVVLPHGTVVKIITSNNLVNVWIMPGSYDRDHTLGLCGTYNGNSTDDLTLPNGTLYAGPGTGFKEQPRDFNLAWRVPENELIFHGARPLNDSFSPMDACTCTHQLFVGARCECGRGTVTELCDLFMDNEYTAENMSSIAYKSPNNGSLPYYLRDIDLNEDYEPPDLVWKGKWNESAASEFCLQLIANTTNDLARACLPRVLPLRPDDIPDIHGFCVQDIQILDNTIWQQAAIDNAKFRCFNKLFRSSRTLKRTLERYVNNSCVNDCNSNGLCVGGECVCNEGFYGPDCQLTTRPQPYLTPKTTELCDSRHQLCHFASIFGQHFPQDGSMQCQIQNVEISPEGVDYLPKRYSATWQRAMLVISSNQAVCPLPGNGSYEVYTVWNGGVSSGSWWSDLLTSTLFGGAIQKVAGRVEAERMQQAESVDVKFIFIGYDSVCFSCDAERQSCQRKETADHCWINSSCWSPGATKPDDPCRYCEPNVDMNDWIISDATEVCRNQAIQEQKDEDDRIHDMTVRGAIGGSISALVVIIVIILYCVSKKREKARQGEPQGEDVRRLSLIDATQKQAGVYENLGLIEDNQPELAAVQQSGSFRGTPKSVKHVTRVEVLKTEERQKGSSLGENHSLGVEGQRTSL